MATSTNFGWTEPDDTDLVKNGAAAMRTLGNAIDSSLYNAVGKAAGKNAVINGGMDIWQRGTSAAGSYPTYLADRWMNYRAVAGSTFSRQNTNDTTNLPNIQYCQRIQRDSGNAATNPIYISQSLESVNSRPFAGQTVTLSFYARAGANFSGASSNMSMELNSGTGTDQNNIAGFTGQAAVISTLKTLTTTWQRFTATGTVSASATQLGIALYYTPVGTAGAADYFEVTGVQLELGSSATPFSRAGGTIQGELAACQRYYYRTNPLTQAYQDMVQGQAASTTDVRFILRMPTTMRTIPSAIEYSTLRISDYNTNIAVTSLGGSLYTPDSVELQATVTGATQFRPYILQGNNSTSAYVAVTAEL